MNLDALGLELEADIYNEKSDARAFIATNATSQVDSYSDSKIVIAFRGTASSKNVKTDFQWAQEALPETFIAGADGQAEYQVNVSSTSHDLETGCAGKATLVQNEGRLQRGLIHDADHILRSAPITRQAFPCVHSGFIQAYSSIRDEIIEKVIEVMERQITKALDRCNDAYDDASQDEIPFVLPKIYVTGHSLGGALAQLLALDISCNIEIKMHGSSKHRRTEHIRGQSDAAVIIKNTFSATDAASISVQKRSRTTSDQRHSANERKSSRRNSFPSPRKNGSPVTIRRAEDSAEFVLGMLSGIGFAGGKDNSRSLRPPVAVYTFGQPRVGNYAFARFYKAHVPHTFRVVSEGDAITSLPFPMVCSLALYKHAGLEVILDEGR